MYSPLKRTYSTLNLKYLHRAKEQSGDAGKTESFYVEFWCSKNTFLLLDLNIQGFRQTMHDYQNYKAPDNLLENRTILITGANRGIGKTAALTFAQHGATVLLTGRNVQALEETFDAIKAQKRSEPAIIPLDLNGATKKNYLDLSATIQSQYQKLDGLLFNAGLLGTLSPIEAIPEKEFDEVMQVNLKSNFLMTQALLPLLRESTDASIIYTTSTVGHIGKAYWGTYSISKFAVEGLMQIVADESQKTNVRANCINPGATRTHMRARAFPGEDPMTLLTPEDIMPLYLYLMGPDSRQVNGQNIRAQEKG